MEIAQRFNPYGVPYRPDPVPNEGSDSGTDWGGTLGGGEVLSAFGRGFKNSEAKPRKAQFSTDQVYLVEKVNASAKTKLTYGGLAKLNATFGITEVSEALRDCLLAGVLLNPYAYTYAICRETP